jgi:gluconolactonase
MRNVVALAGALLALAMPAAGQDAPRIVRLEPRLDALVPAGAAPERVAGGFSWVEGPVWHPEGFLLFTDIPANRIVQWIAGRGTRVWLERAGWDRRAPFNGFEPGANGLALDANGRVIAARHGERNVARLERDGRWSVLADRYDGKRLNSPNDVIVDSRGDVMFTDPPFGLPRGFDDAAKELAFSGVYRRGRDGSVSLLTRELRAPNGIAFSPDERTLYVSNAESARAVWMAYPVRSDGTLGAGRILLDATTAAQDLARRGVRTGNPDGMKVDRSGNLFAAGPGGLWIIAPDGAHLGTVEFPFPVSNCAFGEDGSTLFITADTGVWRLRLATAGPVRHVRSGRGSGPALESPAPGGAP